MVKKLAKQTGATLLELMLVLAIAVLIIIASLRLLRFHEFEMSTQKLKESLAISSLLANQYYFGNDSQGNAAHCHEPTTLLTKHIADLKAWAINTHSFGQAELDQIVNPLGDAIEISYLRVPNPQTVPAQPFVYLIQISARLTNASQLGVLRAELNADSSSSGNTLIWTRLPLQNIAPGPNPLWVASKLQWWKLSKTDPLYASACPK